ncbi:MAG: hypothetical protein K0R61_5216 [Microvirga sp.]|nr:hypothetical protein [Microvirga sp.]
MAEGLTRLAAIPSQLLYALETKEGALMPHSREHTSRCGAALRQARAAARTGRCEDHRAVWALIEQSERSLIRRWFDAPRFRASINGLCATARSRQDGDRT